MDNKSLKNEFHDANSIGKLPGSIYFRTRNGLSVQLSSNKTPESHHLTLPKLCFRYWTS